VDRTRHVVVSFLLLMTLGLAAARSFPNPAPRGATTWVVSTKLPDQTTVYTLGMPMDLCLATEAELRMLPGIGATRARAIVSHRREQGIEVLDDLVDVRGIGPGTIAGLERYVSPKCRFSSRRSRRPSERTDAPN
jgi:DNA uptake protein ComE-like DNA-binding protein